LATELEAFEEAAPDGLDGGGVVFPLLVEVFEQGGVAGVAQPA